MKKFLVIPVLCAALLSSVAALFATGPNINSNQSAEAIKSVSRGASTEPDATVFNPAGTARSCRTDYIYI
jgi:hypothetical protein